MIKLAASNIRFVYSVFEKNYQLVPLEIFKKDPYKTLVSTLLSARTRDEVTLEAAKRLFKKAPNIADLGLLDTKTLEEIIYPVGFYKTKASYLKQLANTLARNHQLSIPANIQDLLSLPGVGRKTANLVLNRAFNIPAIAVDTHVHRISNLLGWVKTQKPEQTERELIKIIPRRYWSKMNRLFVSIGRQYRSKSQLITFLKANGLI